jgi:hypothetical protein
MVYTYQPVSYQAGMYRYHVIYLIIFSEVELGFRVDITTVFTSGMRQLGIIALRANGIINGFESMMASARAGARFRGFFRGQHNFPKLIIIK